MNNAENALIKFEFKFEDEEEQQQLFDSLLFIINKQLELDARLKALLTTGENNDVG